MEKPLRYSLVLAVAAFFAVMWGLLLRSHFPLESADRLRPFYENLLEPGEQERTVAWGIYLEDNRIGHANTRVWRDQMGGISIHTTTEIDLKATLHNILGVSGVLDVDFKANISPMLGLQSFDVTSKMLNTELMGTVADDRMLISGHIGKDAVRTSLPCDEQRMLSEVLSPISALPPLDEAMVGQEWTLDLVNPIAGKVQEVTVTIISFKDLRLADETTTVFKVLFATRASQWTSWVTEEGTVLVQGTPFGITLQREDIPAEALAELKATFGQKLRPPE